MFPCPFLQQCYLHFYLVNKSKRVYISEGRKHNFSLRPLKTYWICGYHGHVFVLSRLKQIFEDGFGKSKRNCLCQKASFVVSLCCVRPHAQPGIVYWSNRERILPLIFFLLFQIAAENELPFMTSPFYVYKSAVSIIKYGWLLTRPVSSM